jgi:uncharacterized protein GlcG (DUF336 family)
MNKKLSAALVLAVSTVFAAPAFAADRSGTTCANLPNFEQLQDALAAAVPGAAGFGLPMWATLVDSSGRVCAVAKLDATDPWVGSRVISAQKANTANAFSTENIALSTANLYSAVQPGGSLYGLQHSNPVNTMVAYRGAATAFGTATDPMVGLRVGGVNVFGGGLALYNTANKAIGAIGVSGDTSCADHEIAWKLRTALVGKGTGTGLVANKVPGGVTTETSGVKDDNIQYPETGVAPTGWEHAQCPVTGNIPAVGALTN